MQPSWRAIVWCGVLAAASAAVADPPARSQTTPPATTALRGDSELQALYDAHQWFALRNAVQAPGVLPFYRAAVAAAFNGASAERDLRRVIAADPHSSQSSEARGLLIAVYQRTGRFADARKELEELVRAQPGARGVEDAAALFGVFARHPPQTIAIKGAVALRSRFIGGNLFVPVTINGVSASYLIDTAANLSLLSGAEARRAGLRIEMATTHVTDATGASIPTRMAVADRLSIGGAELRHVAFFVVADDEQPFANLREGERGVLGLPVLMALRTIRWSADGTFEAARPGSVDPKTHPNICFDGAMPVTEAALGRETFNLMLDTGAVRTDLWPAFARQFSSLLESGQKGSQRVTGVGGRVEVAAVRLPSISLRIGGREMPVGPVQVLLQPVDAPWYHGRLGIDVLSRAARFTIDLQHLRLTVE